MIQDFSTHCQSSPLYVHTSAVMKIIQGQQVDHF